MHRHSTIPIRTTSVIAGTAAAPIACTAKGTMPVTRMVPASPMTNAPHQFVPRCSDVSISAGVPPVLVLIASSPPPGPGAAIVVIRPTEQLCCLINDVALQETAGGFLDG